MSGSKKKRASPRHRCLHHTNLTEPVLCCTEHLIFVASGDRGSILSCLWSGKGTNQKTQNESLFACLRKVPKGSYTLIGKHWGSHPFKPPRANPHTKHPRAATFGKWKRLIGKPGETWHLPGIPGEKHPNPGLSAIAVWFWLAQRALRPVILVYNFDERHTPEGEGKSCAPQALSPVPLWRPSKALGLQCRDKCLTPRDRLRRKPAFAP